MSTTWRRRCPLVEALAERKSEWTAAHYADASEEGYTRAKRDMSAEFDALAEKIRAAIYAKLIVRMFPDELYDVIRDAIAEFAGKGDSK